MYSNEQSRINAIISYFFLGPFMLFAKKDTPLADPYVQTHAKASSKIIGAMLLLVVGYFFVYRYINFGIPGIGLNFSSIVLASIVGITIIYLAKGAYMAFQGNMPGEAGTLGTNAFGKIEVSGVYNVQSEEEKSRILASMIPFFGVWIAKKYNLPIMIHARTIGSCFAFFYILTLIFSKEDGLISTIVLIAGIVLFVVEGIYLFLYNSFVSWNLLDKIPTYNEVESHILSGARSVLEFLKISFGKSKSFTYKELFTEYYSQTQQHEAVTEKYFMPAGLIGLPFWNLFCLPSLFLEKYRPYRKVVLEGLIITLIVAFFFFWKHDYSSPFLLLLLFPISYIVTYASSEQNIHTPGIGLITHIFHFAKSAKDSVSNSSKVTTESFTYSAPANASNESK